MSNSITTRRAILAAVGLPVVVLAALVLAASQAVAFTGYSPPAYFGAAGSGAGQFSEPAGVAVNDATHEVYVYDAGNLRVERFSAAGGKFEGEFDGSESPTGRFSPPASISEHAAHGTLFNLAVDNDPSSPSAEDVYVVDPGSNVIDKFSASGVYLSQLSGFDAPIFGLAVDHEGNVWVEEEGSEVNGNHGVIREFGGDSANTPVGELNLPALRSPGIGVDSAENLYVLKGEPNIAKFDKTGATIAEQITFCGCLTGVAVDDSNSDVFADEGHSIAVYGPFGEPYESVLETLEGISGSRGIAVDGSDHTVYASQREQNSVAVYKFRLLPDVTTGEAASEVERTSAKLEGEVNPDEQAVTSCEFEYGTSEEYANNKAYGKKAPCESAPGSGSSFVPVAAPLAGLTAQTTYHFRLVAGNTNGTHAGADKEFTTPPAVENVATEGVVSVGATTATVEGSLEPNGLDTEYLFESTEYLFGSSGITVRPGPSTELQDAGSASEDVHVSAQLRGLRPNVLYSVRIVAENSLGRTDGGSQFFKTEALAPTIPGEPTATFIAAQSADLNAAVNPENTSTHYHFEYGPCPTLTGCTGIQSTPDETSAAYGTIGTSAEMVGLAPSTTYAYRLVATNRLEETTVGAEATFTTNPASIPGVATGAYTVLGATSAIVSGTVEPHGVPTSYTIEAGIYKGASTQYGIVASGSAGSSEAPVPVSAALTGLQPGSTYAYQVTISSGYILNETHTLTGSPGRFTTPGLVAVLVPPPLLAQLAVPAIVFPPEMTVKAAPKKLTRAQRLADALKACAKRPKSRRTACKRAAHKKYEAGNKAKK
jgi:hypothetical protein